MVNSYNVCVSYFCIFGNKLDLFKATCSIKLLSFEDSSTQSSYLHPAPLKQYQNLKFKNLPWLQYSVYLMSVIQPYQTYMASVGGTACYKCSSQGILTEGKAEYNWTPCTNKFRSAAFDITNTNYFYLTS